jgi:hypothetical protein
MTAPGNSFFVIVPLKSPVSLPLLFDTSNKTQIKFESDFQMNLCFATKSLVGLALVED